MGLRFSGTACSLTTSRLHRPRFDPVLRLLSVQIFTYSPRAYVDFLHVLQFPPASQKHAGKYTGDCTLAPAVYQLPIQDVFPPYAQCSQDPLQLWSVVNEGVWMKVWMNVGGQLCCPLYLLQPYLVLQQLQLLLEIMISAFGFFSPLHFFLLFYL